MKHGEALPQTPSATFRSSQEAVRFFLRLARPTASAGKQAPARHSTIDLTMGVYTDVGIEDLHGAVESLETAELRHCGPATPSSEGASSPELARLVSSWDKLPENVRAAISSLAEG